LARTGIGGASIHAEWALLLALECADIEVSTEELNGSAGIVTARF